MKYWCLLFLVMLSQQMAFCMYAPTDQSESLTINHNGLDALNIDKLNNLSISTYLSNPAYARKLAAKALLSAKGINYKKGIGQSFLNIGITYWSQSYNSISLLYLDTALHYLQKDQLLTSDCYRYIGRNYTDLKDYKSAALYLQKAQDEAGSDEPRIRKTISELSLLYLNQKQLDKALTYVTKAAQIPKGKGDSVAVGVIYSRFAEIYHGKGEYVKALLYCDTSLRLSYLANNKRLRASLFVTKAGSLIDEGKIAEGLVFAKQAQLLSDSLGVLNISASAYKTIVHAYDLLNDSKQALFYQKQYASFLEKKSLAEKDNSAQLIHDYFEINNKLADISKIAHNQQDINNQVKSQQQLILTLLVSLVFVAVALYIVYFYYREKNMLAEQLQEQNASIVNQSQLIEAQSQHLEELNGFKSRLLAIIGHDLRAPITNLRNIADMFDDGVLTEEEVIGLMKTISPIVKGAELTLSNLLVWAGGQLQGAKSIQASQIGILKVINEAEQIFKHQLDKKGIKLVNNITDDCLIMADESHLKVIFNNLVSNAIKFTENNGTITVGVEQREGEVITSIADTGVGMTESEVEGLLSSKKHFSKPGTMGEKGTGIGLRLCRELVELNGGKMWLISKPGNGTVFYFSLAAC